MTIPTRDDALKALDKLSSDYDLAGGWTPDPMPLFAALRSYIAHTGASPVQPVSLEWDGDHLEFNGVKIGNLIRAGGGGEQYHSFTVYDCPTKAMKRSDKIAEMEQRARQWLSGGDK